MSLQARFLSLDGAPLFGSDGWQVERCTWAALGGPEEAELRLVNPTPANLAALGALPGAALELWDSQRGLPAWWGRIIHLEVQRGSWVETLSLEGMANRVAVSYLQSDPEQAGVQPVFTDWAENPVSIARYGLQERVLELENTSPGQANAFRDAFLAYADFPQSRVERADSSVAEPQVRLRAVGWWQSLNHRFVSVPAARAECRAYGSGIQAVGAEGGNQKIAQSFSIASPGWRAAELWLLVRRQGSPIDDLRVEVAADDAGLPGPILASLAIGAANLPADFRWIRSHLAAPIEVSGTLWIIVSRSGSMDAANHYRLRVDESNYQSEGELRIWDGSTWALRSPSAGLAFQLSGGVETRLQMERLANSAVPPLSAVAALQSSGIFSDPYCSGVRSAGWELAKLLSGGAGERRWLARVTPGRQLLFYPQPPSAATYLRLGSDGEPRLADGRPATPADALAGEWMQVESRLSAQTAEPIFIEQVTWCAGKGLALG